MRQAPHRPLFQARHYYWIAHEVPKACLLAGCSLEQTRKVVEILTERLTSTHDLYTPAKFKRECERVIWEVQRDGRATDG